jgi:serine phosphatase RsbU (regulator of sigma subunit)
MALAIAGRGDGAEAVQDAILREIERFEQGARATDDRTLVVLKREGQP